MKAVLVFAALVLTAGALAVPVRAQVPPAAAEVLGYEGLHQAAWRGDLPRLKALIEGGADLQLADRQGNTPLQLARARGYRAMVEKLKAAGAK